MVVVFTDLFRFHEVEIVFLGLRIDARGPVLVDRALVVRTCDCGAFGLGAV